ncbi:hypothetical protein JCM19992_20520 [Thermostilla marina]
MVVWLGGCSGTTEPTAPSPSDSKEPQSAVSEEAAQGNVETAGNDEPGETERSPITPDRLREMLIEKNPAFSGELTAEPNGRGEIALLSINDPNVTDISPLADLPLIALDLFSCGVSDLSPLKGKPIQRLGLDRTKVTDLSPLAGMPLEILYASETEISDLSPLAGCRTLKQLNLARTKVSDLSPLRGLPLETLWLNDTPVSDLSPLQGSSLVSLTIAGTKVKDLSPLRGIPLQRLHIARSEVTDLSPIRWLRLTRLVFTPSKIETGLDEARLMTSLQEIGTAFGEEDWGIETRMYPPSQFWRLYDAGELKE